MYAIREKTKAAVQVCAACGGTYEKAIQEPIPASSCKEPEQTAGVQPYPDHLRQFCDRDRTGYAVAVTAHCQPLRTDAGDRRHVTATSATCVTGLVVRDTWTQFTWFGQAVILVLIQVGGLGLVTLTSFLRWPCGGAWASGTCECWARACRLMATRRPRTCCASWWGWRPALKGQASCC